MQLTNLYTILSSESTGETTWTVQVKLNPDQVIYQGHFPQQPVVPGVCLLHIIKECIETIRQQRLQFTQIATCKFLSSINPSEAPQVSFSLTFKETEEGKLQLQAEGSILKGSTLKENAAAEDAIEKDITVVEDTAANECFIKLKAVLTPRP